MKTYILLFDLGYYPNEHWVEVVSAYDLDRAKHLVLEKVQKVLPELKMDYIDESLSEWIELPVKLSKQGTYFPKVVTHALRAGEHTNLRSVKILKEEIY